MPPRPASRLSTLARDRWPFALGLLAGAGLVLAWLAGGNLTVALAAVPLFVILLVEHSWFRIALVIGGGMYVLGSSLELSPIKVVYSLLVVLCAVIAGLRVVRGTVPAPRLFRPLVWFGLAVVLTLVAGFLLDPARSLPEAARTGIFYLLITAAPLIAIDAAPELRPQHPRLITFAVGVISAIGFGTDWLERRGVSALQVGRFVLSSLLLPAFAFALALVALGTERGLLRRLPWLAAVVVIPIAMLVTGTRTNLVIFVALLGILGRAENHRLPPLQALRTVGTALVLIAAAFPLVAQFVVAQPGFIDTRVRLLLGAVSGRTVQDESLTLRLSQSARASQMIAEHPFFGVGVGHPIPFTLDSPLLTVARLGILGTGALVAFLVACAVLVRRSALRYGRSEAHTAFWGFALVAVAQLPIGSPLEDHGFGFALILSFLGIMVAIWESERKFAMRSAQHGAKRPLPQFDPR